MKFPDIIGSYMFTFIKFLPKHQYNMLIPKIALKLNSNDTQQHYFAIKFLGELDFGILDEKALIDSKIIEKIVQILDFSPNFPGNVLHAIIKILGFFIDYFVEQEDENTLNLMVRACLKMIIHPKFDYFLVFAVCLISVFESFPKLKNFKPISGGEIFLTHMKRLLEEKNEEKLNFVYNLVSKMNIFEDFRDHMELNFIIDLLIEQMGTRLNSQELLDSSWVLLVIEENLKRDIFPWADKIMTKSINILKHEQKSNNEQIVYFLISISFLTVEFPNFVMKYLESPGFLDLILKFSLVCLFHFDSRILILSSHLFY
jgi:hypothetical protein